MKLRKPNSDRATVARAIRRTHGFIKPAARQLCVTRATLYTWLRAHGLELEARELRAATGWTAGRPRCA